MYTMAENQGCLKTTLAENTENEKAPMDRFDNKKLGIVGT
jgi:hypothetical protein